VPDGFHHITLRVTDLVRARAFYEGVLGFEVDQDFPGRKLRLRPAGTDTRLVLVPPLPGTPADDRFTERRIGLDHLAVGIGSRAELDRMAEALQAAGVPVELNHDGLGNAIVHFRDPDNFQWELFEAD
jgi:glyoxylase I family protein